MIGRVDVLDVNDAINHWKANGLDSQKFLQYRYYQKVEACVVPAKQDHDFSLSIDGELIEKAKNAIENKEPVKIDIPIYNYNRTVGATLSS